MLVLLAATHVWWLTALGRGLVRSEEPVRADVAVVLGGDYCGQRILTASELVRAGYVPRVLVSGPMGFYGHFECDLAVAFAVRFGYPVQWYIRFPNAATSTSDEARLIVPELRRRGVRRFLLVTSNFHTARAARLFRRAGSDLEMRVVGRRTNISSRRRGGVPGKRARPCFLSGRRRPPSPSDYRNMRESWRTLGPYLWRYRRGLSLGLGALVLKDVAGVLLPLIIRAAIDALTHHSGARAFLAFAALLACVSAVKGVFQYWMRVIIISISRDIEYDLRNDLFGHLVGLSPDYYARMRTGDIMARATNDLNAVRMMLGPGIMYWTETSLTFVLAVEVMVSVDWHLAVYALLPAPAVSLAVIFFGRAIHERFERIQAMFSDISSRVQENIAGVRMIRAFVQEQAELRRFELLNREYIGQNLRLVRISGVFQPLLEMLIGITFLVVLWVGGYQVLSGRISLGSFVMFNTYMGMLVWPMIALGWVVNLMQRGTASLGRINQIFAERPTIAAPAAPRMLPGLRGEIECRKIG